AAEKWNSETDTWHAAAQTLRNHLIDGITRSGGRFIDPAYSANAAQYSPYIVLASFAPIPGEVLVRVMNDRGFCISTGSACSSKGNKNTRVLEQMGLDHRFAAGVIRISIGQDTTIDECTMFLDALEEETRCLKQEIRGL
ncbi:MAG: hypothetical protein HN368_24410, partial [Spirochaetales bacterium]|nr:hypothetical protein [Spirochaetales bacterium]